MAARGWLHASQVSPPVQAFLTDRCDGRAWGKEEVANAAPALILGVNHDAAVNHAARHLYVRNARRCLSDT